MTDWPLVLRGTRELSARRSSNLTAEPPDYLPHSPSAPLPSLCRGLISSGAFHLESCCCCCRRRLPQPLCHLDSGTNRKHFITLCQVCWSPTPHLRDWSGVARKRQFDGDSLLLLNDGEAA